MATTISNVSELVEPLKRQVAGPGQYDATFPDGDDDTLFAYLTDAFGEAQLDTFLGTNGVDWVTGDFTTALTLGEASLVIIYAAMSIIRSQISAATTKATYKAGPVEYSTENSATVLKGMLDALAHRRDQLVKTNYKSLTWIGDSYWSRANAFQGGLRGSNFRIFYPDDINPQATWDL